MYEVDGSWRDIYVLNASRADWKIWADFVNTNYRVKFTDGDGVQHSQIDFAVVESYWDGNGQANMLTATFFVGEIDIKCHFFDEQEIENDLDPRKIDSGSAHLQLMDFLTRLSQALEREVVLTRGNNRPATCFPPRVWQPLLTINGEQIRVYPF